MNQILVIDKNLIYNNKKSIYKKIYLYLFCISITFFTTLLFNFINSNLIRINETRITHILKNKYNISKLYDSNSKHQSLTLSNNISVIGSIQIPKIDISYPILENTNEDLLKISVCRFFGPLPNRIGNLCIAGHNYKNNSMFSKLHKLNIGDSFYVTDLNNTRLKYIIYKKNVVREDDINCTEETQEIEITLITCNNIDNSKRLVLKAKMESF